jgi:hypothetical protein
MTTASAGDIAVAVELAEDAVVTGTALDSSFGQIDQLGALTVAPRTIAMAGRRNAVAVVDLLTDETFRETARRAAAATAAAAGRFGDAVIIAVTAVSEPDRMWTLAKVARMAAGAGHLEVARKIVSDINPPHDWAPDDLVYVYAALRDWDKAMALVEHAESTARAKKEPRWRDEGLVHAARILVYAGAADDLLCRFSEIVQLAEDTGGPRWRRIIQHSARQVLAAAELWYARAGDVGKVWEFAGQIGHAREYLSLMGTELPRADLLADAAEILVESAGLDKALAVARSIGDRPARPPHWSPSAP